MKQEQIMKGKSASEKMRVVRGYAIISKGDVPQKVDDNTFTIPSQKISCGNEFSLLAINFK